MKLTAKFLLVLAVCTAAAGAAWYWYQSRAESGEVKYRLAKVERGPMAAAVVASGTLNAVTTVQVGSQISGQVKEIYADFNTAVKKGQVIARIDPATYELRVNQTRADLDAAESAVAVARSGLVAQQAELGRVKITLADAERDLERKKLLVDKKFISPAELDKARVVLDTTREQMKAVQAQIQVSEAQVQSALAAVKQRDSLLRQAQVDLERTIIRAPVDGTVILRNVDAGQTVAASLQAPVLFTIAQDLRDMQVEAAIDEAEVERIRSETNARIAEILTAEQRPTWERLLAESGARGQATVGRVYVLENGEPQPLDVRLGMSDGMSTEVLNGLRESQEVIIGT